MPKCGICGQEMKEPHKVQSSKQVAPGVFVPETIEIEICQECLAKQIKAQGKEK